MVWSACVCSYSCSDDDVTPDNEHPDVHYNQSSRCDGCSDLSRIGEIMDSTFWLIFFGYFVGYVWSSIPFAKIWDRFRTKPVVSPECLRLYRSQNSPLATKVDINAITNLEIISLGGFPGLSFTRCVSWKRLGNGNYEVLVTYESLPKKEVS